MVEKWAKMGLKTTISTKVVIVFSTVLFIPTLSTTLYASEVLE